MDRAKTPEQMSREELIERVHRLERDAVARRFVHAIALALQELPMEHGTLPFSMAEYTRQMRLARSTQGCRRCLAQYVLF